MRCTERSRSVTLWLQFFLDKNSIRENYCELVAFNQNTSHEALPLLTVSCLQMHPCKPTNTIFLILGLFISAVSVQAQSWTLWASGLQSGVYPRMTVAPNHDIFYTLLGTGINAGYVWKANTQQVPEDIQSKFSTF